MNLLIAPIHGLSMIILDRLPFVPLLLSPTSIDTDSVSNSSKSINCFKLSVMSPLKLFSCE